MPTAVAARTSNGATRRNGSGVTSARMASAPSPSIPREYSPSTP